MASAPVENDPKDLDELIRRFNVFQETNAGWPARLVETIARVTALEKDRADMKDKLDTIHEVQKANADKLDTVLDFLKHANSAWGFARKYAPHVATFGIGMAVATGRISAETGKSFLHLLGL